MCGFDKIYICTVLVLSLVVNKTITSVLFLKDKEKILGAEILRHKDNVQIVNDTKELKSKNYTQIIQDTQKSTGRTWRVGRVSHKQYEIINMLWKSTTTPLSIQKTENMPQNLTFTTLTSSTNKSKYLLKPSYIEFYYFDEDENIISRKLNTQITFPITNTSQFKTVSPSPVVLSSLYTSDSQFKRVTNSTLKQNIKNIENCQNIKLCSRIAIVKLSSTTATTVNRSRDTIMTRKPFYFTTVLGKKFITKKVFIKNKSVNHEVRKSRDIDNNNLKLTLNYTAQIANKKYKVFNLSDNKENPNVAQITPAQDKVKFFEKYDVNTPPAYVNDLRIGLKNGYLYKTKILNLAKEATNTTDIEIFSNNSTVNINNNATTYMPQEYRLLQNGTSLYNRSRSVSWSDYPFIAAYIHEPSDIRCDAASLSAHWLLAAASCLSRYNKDFRGQSPFVTYCGKSWKFPKRITYVKYSLLHPNYNLNDPTLRYKYNVGLIQVVASMPITCPGWSPVSLMSHVFTADQGGSLASAVGWGIDRYVTTDPETLPNGPLMKYDSVIYSDSCPGTNKYSKLNNDNEQIFKDVYCLVLPPYLGESSDPVHGALLMTEEKLIALYLREERRSWGEQSAEYTALWHLIPWIQETSREPEAIEDFFL